jgi:hypothetical protein
VDARFIDGMAQAGYRDQELAALLRARDHGADPEYAADMVAAGFGHLPLETLIQARDHGVSPMSARRMREHHSDLTIDEIIQRHDRGERD